MKKAELIGAALFLVLGVHVIQQSLQLEMWAKFGPGPGFMPLLIGIFWIVVSAMHAANILLHPQLVQGPHPFPHGATALRLLLLFGILLASVLLIPVLGFLISILLLVAACLKVMERYSWRRTALGSIVIVGACYLIFVLGIGVILPAGPLGF
jgi:hypothetical protein